MLITITRMLSHSLIFLCLAVYACCMPLQRRTGIIEIQGRLKGIQKQQGKYPAMIPRNASMTSVDIPDEITKECENYNFDKFFKALNLMTIEGSQDEVKKYEILLHSLKNISENPDVKFHDNNPCKTARRRINILLEEFAHFLKEVHGYSGNNKAR